MMFNHPRDSLTRLDNLVEETALVAMIRQEPAEISGLNSLEFKESYDDLDFLVYAILPLPLDSQVSLIRHQHSPDPGLEICVRPDQPEIASVLRETLNELKLTRSDLTWVHPKYAEQLDTLLEETVEILA